MTTSVPAINLPLMLLPWLPRPPKKVRLLSLRPLRLARPSCCWKGNEEVESTGERELGGLPALARPSSDSEPLGEELRLLRAATAAASFLNARSSDPSPLAVFSLSGAEPRSLEERSGPSRSKGPV